MPLCPHKHVAVRLIVFRDLPFEVFCGTCCKTWPPDTTEARAWYNFRIMENPILETHNRYTVDSVSDEKPRPISFKVPHAYVAKFPSIFDNRDFTEKIMYGFRWSTPEEEHEKLVNNWLDSPYYGVNLTQLLNQEKLLSTPISQQPNQTPYWIIVSDDGPSTHPNRHSTKTPADAEALRLSEKNPGKTFTVFEAKTSYLTPRAETKKTEYAATPYYAWDFKYVSGYAFPCY